MKQIYIFSGLGVDKRVFQFLDFTGFEVTFIKWIKPDVNESIEAYAKRLATQITARTPILIGLSFGGMVATEVAKFVSTEKVILIASAKTYREVPIYYRWAGYLKLHKLLPTTLLKQHTFVSNWAFGIESEADKILLEEILKDLDEDFLKWAIDKIMCWKNTAIHPGTVHIHGDNDHILPLHFANANLIVKGGGHFMTVNKAKEITKLLRSLLL